MTNDTWWQSSAEWHASSTFYLVVLPNTMPWGMLFVILNAVNYNSRLAGLFQLKRGLNQFFILLTSRTEHCTSYQKESPNPSLALKPHVRSTTFGLLLLTQHLLQYSARLWTYNVSIVICKHRLFTFLLQEEMIRCWFIILLWKLPRQITGRFFRLPGHFEINCIESCSRMIHHW